MCNSGIQVCESFPCQGGETDICTGSGNARERQIHLACESPFQRTRAPSSPPVTIETAQSAQGTLSTCLLVMIDPLQSDGNRPYVLGKLPTLQGGMDE